VGEVSQVGRDHQRLGLAVIEDVGRLITGQVEVHRREVEPGAQAGPVDLEDRHIVGRQQADHVTDHQAGGAPRIGQAYRTFLQFGVAAGGSSLEDNDGGLIG
jgi:hypothetical protein